MSVGGILLFATIRWTLRRMGRSYVYSTSYHVIEVTAAIVVGAALIDSERLVSIVDGASRVFLGARIDKLDEGKLILATVVPTVLLAIMIAGSLRLGGHDGKRIALNIAVGVIGVTIAASAVYGVQKTAKTMFFLYSYEAVAVVMDSLLIAAIPMLIHHFTGPVIAVVSGAAIIDRLGAPIHLAVDLDVVTELIGFLGITADWFQLCVLFLSVTRGLHDIARRYEDSI